MHRVLLLLALILCPWLRLTGVVPGPSSAKPVLNIGYLTERSGAESYIGSSSLPAMEAYVAALNQEGGIGGYRLNLIPYDTKSEVPHAVAGAKSLITDACVAIIGPSWSAAAIPVAAIAAQAKVPCIATTASNPNVTVGVDGKLHPCMFRICFTDGYQGTILAEYAFHTLLLRRAAMLEDATSAYTVSVHDSFEKRFRELGGQIVNREAYRHGDTDLRAQLKRIKASKADLLVMASYAYEDGILMARQARELGVGARLLSADGWFVDEILRGAGKELEGAIVTTGTWLGAPKLASYNELLRRSGLSPTIYTYYGLDALAAVEQGIRKALQDSGKVTPASLRDALEGLQDAQLFTCKLTFDRATHNPLNAPVGLIQVRNGRWQLAETLPALSLRPLPKGFEAALRSPSPRMQVQDRKVIKLATQSPLTGSLSVVGRDLQYGAQLALEQRSANIARLGYEVQLAPYDDMANPDTGVANAKQIVSDPAVLAVIGHYNSGVQIPASEEYHAAQLCNLSPANTNPRVTDRGYPEINRLCGRDDVQGTVAAKFALSKGVRKVFILHDKTRYGEGVAEAFDKTARETGLQVIGFLGTEENRSFETILTPLLRSKPDCLFFGGMFDQAALLFRQARERGFQGMCLSDDGFDSSDSARIGGAALLQGAGTYFTIIGGPAHLYTPGTSLFMADFERRFGHKPQPFAAQAYDGASIALQAIENVLKANPGAFPSRAQVSRAVRTIRNFPGITGPVSFNATGDHTRARYHVVQVVTASEGQWHQNRVDKAFDEPPPAGGDALAVAAGNDTEQVFRLGMVAPMTREAAPFGESARRGVNLAIQEWNARGGVLGQPIRLSVADDKGDPAQGAAAYTDLIVQNRVSAIIGPIMSKVALAGAPICQAGEVPMLSPTATHPKVTQVGDYIFRICYIDTFQGTAGARFASTHLKTRRAACLFDVGNDYTKGLSQSFKEEFLRSGGELVAFEGHATGITDFTAQLRRILAGKPQLLYVPDFYNDAAVIIRQARSLGFSGPILGGDGWDSPRLAEIGGKALENTYLTNHYTVDDPRPSVRTFIKRYMAVHGTQAPDAIAALAYDATNVMLEAVKRAGTSEGPAIRKALQALSIDTVCGPVWFDGDRNPMKSAIILKMVDGRPVYCATITP